MIRCYYPVTNVVNAWVNRRGKKAEHLNIEMGKAKFENGGITFQEERSEKTYRMKERGNLKDEKKSSKKELEIGTERIREKSWESWRTRENWSEKRAGKVKKPGRTDQKKRAGKVEGPGRTEQKKKSWENWRTRENWSEKRAGKVPISSPGRNSFPSESFQLSTDTKSATKLGISHFMATELPRMTYSLSASASYGWVTTVKQNGSKVVEGIFVFYRQRYNFSFIS